jgi:UDP-N-acetylglucosamine 4,6-dehydratase
MFYKNKKILIIGGTGTIGSSLVRRLLKEEPQVIRILSRDEHKQFEMQNELQEHRNIRYLLGDIREYERVARAMEGIDIVFSCAALKHVPSCEYNPFEAVKTNVLGTQNVIQASIDMRVEKVIFTSTDKAISPTNTYGATKLVGERLIAAAEYQKGPHPTTFAAVRFGNVMGSRGSVIPLFKKQILEKGLVTVTDKGMSRFMMTLSQATELTLRAAQISRGGEVFVLKMPIVNLGNLVDVVLEEVTQKYHKADTKIDVREIGLRSGEKMYEELLTREEAEYALELEDMYVIPSPFLEKAYHYENMKKAQRKSYSSHDESPISKQELKELLSAEDLI